MGLPQHKTVVGSGQEASRVISLGGASHWFYSAWLRVCLGLTVAGTTFIAALTGAPPSYVCGEIALALSVFLSLRCLADWPLVNPVQAVIALFYWWFGIGPPVEALFKDLVGLPEEALHAQTSGMEALWIVALGLPIYAVAGRLVLRWAGKRRFGLQFLLPRGRNYQLGTLIILLACGVLSDVSVKGLEFLGISGQEELTYLGGTVTNIWWVGVIAGIGTVALLARSAILSELVYSGKGASRVTVLLALVVLLQSITSALTGGWKGAFVFVGLYILVAYVSRTQRIPWARMGLGLILFLFVVEPFVATGRHLAETLGIQTTEEKEGVFRELIEEKSLLQIGSWKEINIGSPFRGIYQLAGEVTRRNALFQGEWEGLTIGWGLLTLVPREFYPDKPPLNIGNFFARTVGVDLGMVDPEDFDTNFGLTIPFEVIGNYGWLAGILSFGLIGAAWSLLSALLLTSDRLSNHPLTPWMVGLSVAFESGVGHFLASVRALAIPIMVAFILSKLLRGKL